MLPVWLTDTVTNDLNRALHYTHLWGLEGVELRTVGGAEDRVPFVNEKQVKQQLEASGLLLASIVPSVFEGRVSDRAAWMNDLVRFDETLRFCQRVHAPRVVVPPFAAEPAPDVEAAADALRQLGEKAADANVIVAVQNGPETTCPTGMALAELLALVDHPNVNAAWDPAGAMRAGEDPSDGLAIIADQVTLVRCSDGRITNGYWEDVPLGEGAIDWTGQLQLLDAMDFVGPVSLEVYVEPRPKHGLRAATTLIEMLRGRYA